MAEKVRVSWRKQKYWPSAYTIEHSYQYHIRVNDRGPDRKRFPFTSNDMRDERGSRCLYENIVAILEGEGFKITKRVRGKTLAWTHLEK